MRTLRPLLDRLGGPDAVSWPLFWVTLVMNVAGHFAFPQPYVPLGARIAAVSIAQVLMFVPLLCLFWALRRAATRPHPLLVIGTYVAATGVRALVFAMLLRAPDGSITITFGARLASSLGLVLMMVATTLLVAASRQHAAAMQRLLQVQRRLAEARDQSQRHVTDQNEVALAQVQASLFERLISFERVEDDRERVASLRHLASEVIRPLSHELAQFTSVGSPDLLDTPMARVKWTDVAARASRGGSFRPAVTAIVMGLMTMAASLIHLRDRAPAFLIAVLIGTGFGLWGANAVLDRTLPRKSVRASFGLVVIAALLVGALNGGISAVIVGGASGIVFGVFGGLVVALVAVVVGLVSSGLAGQREAEAQVAASVEELRVSLVRMRQAQWFHGRALARALHGPMQSAVLAAAYRLEDALDVNSMTPQLIAEVQSDLTRSIGALSIRAESPMALSAFIDEVRSVWSRVAAISIEVTDSAKRSLMEDALLRAMVMEITSEAISNSVRHGRAQSVDLTVTRPPGDLLTVRIVSDGGADAQRAGRGLGSRLLDDCTLDWEERDDDGRRVLIASFPVA